MRPQLKEGISTLQHKSTLAMIVRNEPNQPLLADLKDTFADCASFNRMNSETLDSMRVRAGPLVVQLFEPERGEPLRTGCFRMVMSVLSC